MEGAGLEAREAGVPICKLKGMDKMIPKSFPALIPMILWSNDNNYSIDITINEIKGS